LVTLTIVNNFHEEFLKNLRDYRKEQHISQEKLAEMCGVATSTIGGIESANQNPSFEIILKIAKALNIHPADLFLRDASKTQNQELYRKYQNLIKNCEYIPESHQTAILQLAQSLAEASPEYGAKN